MVKSNEIGQLFLWFQVINYCILEGHYNRIGCQLVVWHDPKVTHVAAK